VEHLAAGWYGHYLRITSPEELDDEVRGWLCESYRLMGEQRRLDIKSSPTIHARQRTPQGDRLAPNVTRFADPQEPCSTKR
jgi:hypothetical protein